ncbi:orotate phosphoribosyltransferase [Kutzneria viridogrisea]|uniref:Orotate phosphoribosyltransferase n=1 Tax=Kutzneria viridogrisea TaxID=47990 RepID=A0ABR6BLW4_9PSEU|nr:phosphoribosyltransferase family protein [Kutzneria albida]MBA8927895.1 orotate phosphoribosyltransferase [Kutzneria viridogrisea]
MHELISAERGHFELESGHHGDLWLDLDRLFLRASRLRPQVAELAARLAPHRPRVVCGPLTGGGFLAQLVAAELDVDFCHAERHTGAVYRVPEALRAGLRDARVAVVDDVCNAGSAVRKTLADLAVCGARPVAVGALLVLGDSAAALATEQGVPLVALEELANSLWQPADCPLCASGVPLSARRS